MLIFADGWSVSLGSFAICIAISSMYTVSHCSAISGAKTKFIIVWNVAGEFVRPKNITVGSNKPSFVMKAAFHSSPFLMRTLLYPQRMSNLVYNEHPLRRSTSCGISGSRYLFFIVQLLIGQ